MIFLQGLWHSLKVVCGAGYWLLTILLVWAGFAQLGTAPQWGWACFAVVLAVFAGRGMISKRYVEPATSYIIACGAYAVFLIFAGIATGYFDPRHMAPQLPPV